MTRVLVIGDGQLGGMLAEAAARLGIELDRLDPEDGLLYHGTGRNGRPVTTDWNAAEYDIVTAEREHLPDNALMRRLAAHPGFGAHAAIALVADRRSQKALLDRLGVPTADWCHVGTRADIERLARASGDAVVVKAARGGYDGRGQWIVDATRTDEVPDSLLGHAIAERRVRFTRELSLVGARGADGRCVFYPLVENRHHAGMLRFTVAPARGTDALQDDAERMLSAVMDELRYVGVMAMELFEEAGELLANELAPRVHNSGHWSQDGATPDQFELHLRALCGLPLPTPCAIGHSVMLNLVGCDWNPDWLSLPQARLHWYGKAMRAGRKLGHINLRADRRERLPALLGALAPLLDSVHARAAREACDVLRAPRASRALAAFPRDSVASTGLQLVRGSPE